MDRLLSDEALRSVLESEYDVLWTRYEEQQR
jgi:hypothetical protein